MDTIGCMLLLAGTCLVLMVPGVVPCSPVYPEPTVEEQVNTADVIVYGKVLRHIPNQMFRDSYTAEMLVYCSLKEYRGQHIGPVINITRAGFIHGMCFGAELLEGEEYIVLIDIDDHSKEFRPQHTPDNSVRLGDKQTETILKSCSLHPRVPEIPPALLARGAPARKECPRTTCPLDHDHDHGDGHDDHDHDHDDHDHGDGHYHGDGHDDHDHGEHDHGDGHYHGDGHDDHDHGDHDHGDGHYHGDGHDYHDHGDHDHGKGHYHGDGHDDHDHGDHDHGKGHYHGDGHDDHDHGHQGENVVPVVGEVKSGSALLKSSLLLLTALCGLTYYL